MLEHTIDHEIHVLRMARGKANALNTEFLEVLADRVEDCNASPARGLILTSEGSIFCAGLDLPELVGLDREGIRSLYAALCRALIALFQHPRPTVASINGHAIAGGALLTLACDLRHMHMGSAKWGLNEAQLGLAMPGFAVELLRYVLSRKTLEKVVYGGGLYPPFKAHDMGILDALVEEGELATEARAAIVERTPSPEAFADIKRRLHAPTAEAMQLARGDAEAWAEGWFREEIRARLTQVVAEMGSRPPSA